MRSIIQRLDPRDLLAALGLASITAGLALGVSLAAALVVAGVLVFSLAVPPRHFLR